MGNSNNSSQQFDDEIQEIREKEDEWEEESVHARKEHQDHRGRRKGNIHHNIEDFKEKQQLKELLGDDYDD